MTLVTFYQNIVLHDTTCTFHRFGFVKFEDVASAEKAKRELDGHTVDGFSIRLSYAVDHRRGGGSAERERGRGSSRGGGRGMGQGHWRERRDKRCEPPT